MAEPAKKKNAPAAKPGTAAAKAKAAEAGKPAVAARPKAPAKPTSTGKTQKASRSAKTAMPPREEIERLARQFWAARGFEDGFAEQDWLRAERELLQKAS